MTVRRTVAALIATLVVASGLVAAPLPAAAQTADVSVSNVSVQPAHPLPGEQVTITPTISNAAGSQSTFDVRAVALRRAGSSNELTRVENLGTVTSGSQLPVPLTATFGSRGFKNLRVHVWGEAKASSQNQHLSYPVTLDVDGQHPGVDVEAPTTVAGADHRANVTIVNGLEGPISNVRVDVPSEADGVVSTDDAFVAGVESGQSTAAEVEYRFDEPGQARLPIRVTYYTQAGTKREVYRNQTVEVQELDHEVVLNPAVVGAGPSRGVAVQVLNQGNAPMENVRVDASSPNATLQQDTIDRIPARSARTARLNVTRGSDGAQATIDVAYEVAQTERTVTDTIGLGESSGLIRLTGVSVSQTGGTYEITGSTSNVGQSDAQSVYVQVMDTESVTPADPNPDYFVGPVPSSDFYSFEVTARTSGEVDTIPLLVTYSVDGRQQRHEFSVDVANEQAQVRGGAAGSDQDGGSSPLPLIVGGLIAVALLVALAQFYFDVFDGLLGSSGDGGDGEDGSGSNPSRAPSARRDGGRVTDRKTVLDDDDR